MIYVRNSDRCHRTGDEKGQSLCPLAMTLHASSGQAFRREAQLTLHRAHAALLFSTKAQLYLFPLPICPQFSGKPS